MASSASISGLSSGLDTATIIENLMSLEAAPQDRLEKRAASERSLVTTLQGLNTRSALLGSRATALAGAAAWTSTTATSTSAAVTVTTTASARASRFEVTVTSLALTHRLGFAQTAALDDVVTGASTTVRLDRLDGTSVDLDTGDGTLSGLVAAINAPANATGLTATAVRTGEGYRLLVESSATGAAQDFTLTASDGQALLGGAVVRAGSDAVVDLGTGITVTSPTGTFADLAPGTTLRLGAGAVVGSTATVSVSADTAAQVSAVGDLVASLNALLTEIDAQTSRDTAKGTSGPLAGDSGVRNLRTALLDALYPADGSSLAALGIQTDRYGKVSLDTAALTAALTADPAGVAARFTAAGSGLAARLAAVADGASNTRSGSLVTAIESRRSGITTLEDGIADWDVRLALRKEALTRQFTALETALNSLSSQSSWLSGQIASLPSWSS